jgi:hypothetical protein
MPSNDFWHKIWSLKYDFDRQKLFKNKLCILVNIPFMIIFIFQSLTISKNSMFMWSLLQVSGLFENYLK